MIRYSATLSITARHIIVEQGGGPHLKTVEAYDPATDTWSTKASIPTARCCLAAGVIGEKLDAVGGLNLSFGKYVEVLRNVEAYDPAALESSL